MGKLCLPCSCLGIEYGRKVPKGARLTALLWGWVALSKSLPIDGGLSFLLCAMEMIIAHGSGVRMSDDVSV